MDQRGPKTKKKGGETSKSGGRVGKQREHLVTEETRGAWSRSNEGQARIKKRECAPKEDKERRVNMDVPVTLKQSWTEETGQTLTELCVDDDVNDRRRDKRPFE